MNTLALSATKRALLDKLLQEKGLASANSNRITRSQRTGSAPLSFGQQRLWFLQQLDPGIHLYNIPAALKMEGPLDVAALEQAINEVIRRHESLRTVFTTVNGQPFQVINPPFHLVLAPVHVDAAGSRTLNDEIACHSANEARHLFDLTTGPLVRAKLLRINNSEHILVLCMHHIISDGWSMGVFLRELSAFYNSCCEGQSPQLPELSVQCQDFALWQQHEDQQAELTAQIGYWKNQLNGIAPRLELPTDYPRTAKTSFRGSAVSFLISGELNKAISQIARSEGATLFMAMAAAFNILLFRYSGQEDFALGTPVAGRTRPELESLIGFFVNTLVLRAKISGEVTFRQLLRHTKEICLGALAHQDLPFERLVEELHPERALGHSPLFQVMLDLQNAPMQPAQFKDLHASLLPIATNTAKYDLTLTLTKGVAGLDAALEYSAGLFEHSTARRMTENFRTLLESIVANPDTKISLMPLLSQSEQTTVLVEWNRTKYNSGDWPPIERSFEEHAEKNPDRPAVQCDAEPLSYRELNRRANQLARYLRGYGAGPEALAGICLERSTTMVIAILAVLKAGAAYVPLDPAYPSERLNSMVKDSRLSLLLTETRWLHRVSRADVTTICLDSNEDQIANLAHENLGLKALPQNPAYVIHTSGSTGRPKGVAISRANLSHSTHARIVYYKKKVRAFLLLPSFSFDSSVAGLFWTLCQGGKLVIPPEGSHSDPVYLANLIQEHSVSHLLCLPSLYAFLLDLGGKKLASLQTVIVAGEVCAPHVVHRHCELLPQTRFFNEYGPTEATVWSTVFDCSSSPPGHSVLIGRPIINTQIYLLDHQLQPGPIGAVGELYVSGDGLGRGYLHNPSLTAERFIPDPFGDIPGSRLYKTGDLARYCATGDIEFSGRNDSQIKIRGHRIELGEIETALAEHPAVHRAIVISDDDSLVCYVILQEPRNITTKDLRSYLGSKLPNYMLPTGVVFMDEFPLTASGKVDCKALALHAPEQVERNCNYIPPRTAMERVLTGIFSAVLRKERFGIQDNFFEAGGHSLLATQVVSRVREALQIDLPLRRIFEQPTVSGLAAAVLSETSESKRLERTAELLLALSGVSDNEASALMEKYAPHTAREVAP